MELIDRRDAIRIVDSIDTWQAGWRGDAIESLKALPPAQPEPIKITIDHAPTPDELERLKQAMRNTPVMLLPSAQSEPCRDALDDAYAHGCNTTMEHIGQLRKIKGGESVEVKVGKIRDAEKRYGLGRTKLREIAADAGAVVRIGRAYRIDFGVMDQYMDDLRQRAKR